MTLQYIASTTTKGGLEQELVPGGSDDRARGRVAPMVEGREVLQARATRGSGAAL